MQKVTGQRLRYISSDRRCGCETHDTAKRAWFGIRLLPESGWLCTTSLLHDKYWVGVALLASFSSIKCCAPLRPEGGGGGNKKR